MSLINKLTPEQEKKIPEYINKWVSKASEKMDHKKTIEYTRKLYKSMGEEPPLIIFGVSPYNTALLCSLFWSLAKEKKINIPASQLDSQLRSQLNSQLYSQLDSQLRSQLNRQLASQLESQLRSQLNSQLYSQLESQLRSQLRSQLASQLDSQLRSQLDSQLRSQLASQLDSQLASQLRSQLASQLRSQLDSQLASQLRSQLDSQLRSQLASQLRSQLDSQLASQLRSQLDSQLKTINSHWYLGMFWLVWCGWYDYGKSIGVKFEEEKYDLFMNFNSEVTFIIPYKGVAFISEKPVELNWRNRNLHKDGGLAVRYSDDWGIHMLNGVRVSKEIAETPAQELKAEILLKEKNAQVRSEIIKKIGYSRILKDLQAKQLDSWREYELYRIDEGDVEPMVLLKYACPSTGAYYAHRVPPQMSKAREAMAWANHGVDPEEFLVET